MFEFGYPIVFLLLPLPILLRRMLPIAKRQPGAALRLPFFERFERLSEKMSYRYTVSSRKKIMLLSIWVLLILTAAKPQWLGDPVAVERTGRNIMLVLDISVSMQIPDMDLNQRSSDRLTVVKDIAQKFVDKREGDQIGLILFGSRAYLQTPLTFDLHTVKAMLDDATIGLAGAQTALGDAIGLAVKHLSNTPTGSRVMILLTDGANNSGAVEPPQAARLAAQEHIKIYTIGLGADRLVVPGLLGPQMINPSADLDEPALKNIAKLTGGVFFRAQDTNTLQHIYAKINSLEPVKGRSSVFRPVTDLYFIPLALAILVSMLLAVGHISLRKLEQQYE